MVKAIGGVFLYSENPRYLAEWYAETLGLDYDYTEAPKAYCVSFSYREKEANRDRYTLFSILYNRYRPFVDGKFFTINLRVENISTVLRKLAELNITVRGPEKHDEGTFAWINDPEGNYIELWEDAA